MCAQCSDRTVNPKKQKGKTYDELKHKLFAESNCRTPRPPMSKEMKTFYEKRLIDQAEPRLVHDQFADYYPVPQNGGKTIEFRK